MAIQKYRPLNLVDELQREMGTLFHSPAMESSFSSEEWNPAVDISEDDDKFTIHADLPGVKSEDIEVTAENGVLIVKGRRENHKEEEKENYRRVERFNGRFMRQFTLPERADIEHISAQTKKGVLELVIPKMARRKPKRIDVRAGR